MEGWFWKGKTMRVPRMSVNEVCCSSTNEEKYHSPCGRWHWGIFHKEEVFLVVQYISHIIFRLVYLINNKTSEPFQNIIF